MSALQRCLDDIGVTEDEWYEMGSDFGGPFDSVMVGACTTPMCDGLVSSVEPDCRHGWCDECGKQSVESIASLLGVI